MSQENVEVVRRAMAAFNARDRDHALSRCDPEIELWAASKSGRRAGYRTHALEPS